jgi:hypothetical protein
MRVRTWAAGFVAVMALGGCRHPLTTPPPRAHVHPSQRLSGVSADERRKLLQRAQVWKPTDVAAANLAQGPSGPGAFSPNATVTCDYLDSDYGGNTPKFRCAVGADDFKVKYGRDNGEVYAAVSAGRLFWALGFGAEPMYSVKVICRRCPVEPWYYRTVQRVKERTYDPAAIERKLPGQAIAAAGFEGWDWRELDLVDEKAGGASRAQVDALKLLAVFVQHGDNQPPQQRFICLPEGVTTEAAGALQCLQPFLYVHDLGATFGSVRKFASKKATLEGWSKTSIWSDPAQCVGQLDHDFYGRFSHPRISEAGRAFLAGLLAQLSDAQIADLFAAGRMEQRAPRKAGPDGRPQPASVDEWVRVFKRKRDEIVHHSCPA